MRHAPILALLLAAPLGAQTFEGAISMNMSGQNGRSTPITYLIKGEKARMEMGGAMQAAMIYDVPGGKMLMVMTQQRMYMEMDLNGAMAGARGQMEGKKPTITRTGRMETIAGYSCEHVTSTDESGKTVDICLSKDLKAQFRMPGSGNPMAGRGAPPPSWAQDLTGFALKVQEGDKVMLEVTKVEPKSLDAALFAPPEGFTKMDMGGMFKRP